MRCSAQLRPEFPDITISKLRFLEAEGLVEPQRTPSGYRKYTADHVDAAALRAGRPARPVPAAAGDPGAARRARPWRAVGSDRAAATAAAVGAADAGRSTSARRQRPRSDAAPRRRQLGEPAVTPGGAGRAVRPRRGRPGRPGAVRAAGARPETGCYGAEALTVARRRRPARRVRAGGPPPAAVPGHGRPRGRAARPAGGAAGPPGRPGGAGAGAGDRARARRALRPAARRAGAAGPARGPRRLTCTVRGCRSDPVCRAGRQVRHGHSSRARVRAEGRWSESGSSTASQRRLRCAS